MITLWIVVTILCLLSFAYAIIGSYRSYKFADLALIFGWFLNGIQWLIVLNTI